MRFFYLLLTSLIITGVVFSSCSTDEDESVKNGKCWKVIDDSTEEPLGNVVISYKMIYGGDYENDDAWHLRVTNIDGSACIGYGPVTITYENFRLQGYYEKEYYDGNSPAVVRLTPIN